MAKAEKGEHQDEQPGIERKMRDRPDFQPRYPGSGRLDGRVAIISGGDSGIGRAVAVLFAREGAKVAIAYLSEDGDAGDAEAACRDEGAETLLLRGDVGNPNVADRWVAETVKRFGRLDVVVNNAAEQHPEKSLADIDEATLVQTFRTNIFGYFHLARAALPHLEEGAAIINTTSVTAYRGSPHLLDYAATKGAIVAFTRSLAGQLAEEGIRVNAVAPGPIWTPLIPSTFPPDKVATFGENVPLGRPGQPNEVAPAFLFLACADSSYMTGQVLHPNGGEIING